MTEKIFDSLQLKKSLESVGIPSHHAEKHIEIMGKIINNHLATKTEIELGLLAVRHDMTKEFAAIRAEMAEEFAAVRSEMASEFADVRSEMRAGFAQMKVDMANMELKFNKAMDSKLRWGLAIMTVMMAIFKYT